METNGGIGMPAQLMQLIVIALLLSVNVAIRSQEPRQPSNLDNAQSMQVDAAAYDIMHRNNVPAISLAIVREGYVVYVKAYGFAELPAVRNSGRKANASTRFAIGSVSKEFTAAAILLLCDRGRLSLDDTVSKYLPELTDADQVTVRELLNHTSGYRDYFLQEYIPAEMQRPTSVDEILKRWAERPLDFSPGQEWQYSGTNYVMAGRIVEKVSGEPYERFLAQEILKPLGITDETIADNPTGRNRNAVGYYRFGLGPPRPAPLTGRNWLFAMADLEMTAKDVALWDISVIDRTLLSDSSYREMFANTQTKDGRSTGYGLGFFVTHVAGVDGREHLMLHHPGEISGFRSHNFILPDLKAAVVILTNAEYSDAASELAERLQAIVGVKGSAAKTPGTRSTSTRSSQEAEENAIEARALRIVQDLGRGRLDREDLAADALQSFTPQAVDDIRASLAPLGALERVTLDSTQLRGGTKHYALTLAYAHRQLQVAEYDLPSGKIEEFFIDDKK